MYLNISNGRTHSCISFFIKALHENNNKLRFHNSFSAIHNVELQQLQIKLVGFLLLSIRVWCSVNMSRSVLCYLLLHLKLAVSVLLYSLNTLLGY